MASRRKKKRDPLLEELSPQARQAIGAVIMGVMGIFFVLSSFGDGSLAGPAGRFTHTALIYLFGFVGFVLAPISCALYVYALMRPRENGTVNILRIIGIVILLLSLLGLLGLYTREAGGLGGAIVLTPLSWLLGKVAAGIILGALTLIGFFLIFNTGIKIPKRTKVEKPEEDFSDAELVLTEESEPIEEEPPQEPGEESGEEPEDVKKSIPERIGLGKKAKAGFVVSNFSGPYAPPPLSLLSKDKGKSDGGDLKANMTTIKRTLKKFNIDVEVDSVTPGSSFTQYAIKPAEGVKLEKIISLQTNLAYALAADSIRIEAPIPGKSLVGIEVPNKQRQVIGLASLFTSPEYTDSPKPLLTVLGRGITGTAEFADIARMPHGLIAGTTGSGKSVVIHNIIISLLFRNSPEQLRFIMVDPKLVELTLYNGIPHLLTPVITEPKRVLVALKWCIKEMDRRLDILRANKVQNITSYHEKVYQPAKAEAEDADKSEDGEETEELPEPLPYIVIIIDELADLMSSYPKELEASIVRLAQKSRAVGIHLILATQRPEVKVITGLIKANMPTRIALKVNSQIDSRTILDQAGAEKLLGKGDMLFLSQESPKTKRLQSAFVTEDEVKKVVQYLKNQLDAAELDALDLSDDNKDNSDAFFESVVEDEDDDDLYEEAKQIVLETKKASTSYLQRRLRIGYSRAARLIDILEERGVIGPADGARPREVFGTGGGSEGAPSDDERL